MKCLPRLAKCVFPLAAALLPLGFAASAGAQQPQTRPSHPDDVPWGISSSASSRRNYLEWFPKMSVIGVESVRLCPEWRGLEPAEGKWEWDATDALVKSAGENHLRISGLLFGSTPWTKEPSHAFPMDHLDAWSHYAATVAEHYKDQITDWEVWNEGNAGFNDRHNTTADYAALVASAYDAVKRANPSAQVGMSVASFDAPYLDQAILAQAKAGKANHFDYLCIHPYELLDGIRESDGEIPYLWMSHLLRQALRADAPERADVPIDITEVGMPVGKKATEADAAKALVKAYVMAIAQGIRRTMWFEARDPTGEEAGFGLLRRDGTPRTSYGTFKTMTTLLGPTPQYVGWLALGKDERGYGFVFAGASGPVLVAWMPAGLSDSTVTFSREVQITDALDGSQKSLKTGEAPSLTDAPLFITALPSDRIEQARANASKPFPWGGDHSNDKVVRIQLGEPSGAAGILPIGRPLPAYKFDDGSTGVEVRNNASAPFFVHPSFAGFKTREYYIRLTLRRIGPGNVGMNFAYEVADTQGQRGPMRHSGGWFSLPDAMGWQTHTWHVTDACFSKMWGYDISFNPEKSVPFVLGKVEVSTEPFDH